MKISSENVWTIWGARWNSRTRQLRPIDASPSTLPGVRNASSSSSSPSRNTSCALRGHAQKLVWSKLDRSSVAAYEKSTAPLRDFFWEEVIGKLPAPTEPLNP